MLCDTYEKIMKLNEMQQGIEWYSSMKRFTQRVENSENIKIKVVHTQNVEYVVYRCKIVK